MKILGQLCRKIKLLKIKERVIYLKFIFIVEEMPVLIDKYEHRIKDFMYKMVADPVKIKDHKHTVYSTRQDFLEK